MDLYCFATSPPPPALSGLIFSKTICCMRRWRWDSWKIICEGCPSTSKITEGLVSLETKHIISFVDRTQSASKSHPSLHLSFATLCSGALGPHKDRRLKLERFNKRVFKWICVFMEEYRIYERTSSLLYFKVLKDLIFSSNIFNCQKTLTF